MRYSSGDRRNRGVALVIVLWMLVLMTVMAAAITTTQRTEVNLSRSQLEKAKGRALALSGVHYALARLTDLDEQKAWVARQEPYEWTFAGKTIELTITDETGRIDLNLAPDELLESLFTAVSAEEPALLSGSIADWRDADNLQKLSGAEDDDYAAAEMEYGAKDSRFDDVSELRLVYGMSAELYALVEPGLTVDSRRRGVNQEHASELVLSAVEGGVYEPEPDYDKHRKLAQDTLASLPDPMINRSNKSGTYRIRSVVSIDAQSRSTVEVVVTPDRQSEMGVKVKRMNFL